MIRLELETEATVLRLWHRVHCREDRCIFGCDCICHLGKADSLRFNRRERLLFTGRRIRAWWRRYTAPQRHGRHAGRYTI